MHNTPTGVGFTGSDKLGAALRNPQVRSLLLREMPELRRTSTELELSGHPISLVLRTSPSLTEVEQNDILVQLRGIGESTHVESQPDARDEPRTDLSVPARSELKYSQEIRQFERFEILLSGPDSGNPFVDVTLAATVRGPRGEFSVPGFYDGTGLYRIRFLVLDEGEYHFETVSNSSGMDALRGSFAALPALEGNRGPVRVSDQFHFSYANGQPYLPIGTTAYAWIHQSQDLQEQTLQTLKSSPFNKIRMCIFPKSYIYNENEPSLFPFVGDLDKGFDFQRFNPRFWGLLEERILQLDEMGIEADLILFHPYDRWGFAEMNEEADDRYLKYAVSRLAAFKNVWWSLANEYDLMAAKTTEDWERFASIIGANDPSSHLISIHNCIDFYDYGRPWITHSSIQRQDLYKTAEMTTEWRDKWGKPVVVDECAYEGDIDQGWGNITGPEMVRRFWEGVVRGGYIGHGEAFHRDDQVLWWSKGGTFAGESVKRISFLKQLLEELPTPLEPIDMAWDAPCAGRPGEFYLYYYGLNQPSYRRFLLDPDVTYQVQIIDTWDMKIFDYPHEVSGRFTIELPAKPYIALLLRALCSDA